MRTPCDPMRTPCGPHVTPRDRFRQPRQRVRRRARREHALRAQRLAQQHRGEPTPRDPHDVTPT
eukprot:4659584-Prymnesium_polylepis.2